MSVSLAAAPLVTNPTNIWAAALAARKGKRQIHALAENAEKIRREQTKETN